MRYTITKETNTIFIRDNQDPLRVLRTDDLTDLLALNESLTQFLAAHQQLTYITTEEALKYASQDGSNIPWKTLQNACTRGTIPNAQKRAGRWIIPESAFHAWYKAWKAKH